MKRFIAFMLCLAVAVSMAACGSETKNEEEALGDAGQSGVESDIEDGDTEASSVDELEETEEPETEAPETEPAAPEIPAVDLTLKPENAELTDSGDDGFRYYETYTLKDATYQEVVDFEEYLRGRDFYITNGSGTGYYKNTAEHLSAKVEELFEYTGPDYISSSDQFAERLEKGIEDRGDFSVTIKMRDLSAYNFPELPKAEWYFSDNNGNITAVLSTPNDCEIETRVTLAKDFVEELKKSGYDKDVTEYPEGRDDIKLSEDYISEYSFMAYDDIGNRATVTVVSSKGTAERYCMLNGYDIDEWSKVEIVFRKAED